MAQKVVDAQLAVSAKVDEGGATIDGTGSQGSATIKSAGKRDERTSAMKSNASMTRTLMGKSTFFNHRPVQQAGDEEDVAGVAASSGCCQKTKNTFEVVGEVVRRHPTATLVPPIVTLVVLIALGVMGTLLGAQRQEDQARDTAIAVAIDTSVSFKLTVEKTFAPAVSVDAFIKQTPYYPDLAPKFNDIAAGLLEQLPPGTIQHLQFSPWGVIREEYPNSGPVEQGGHIGIDIFNQSVLRPGAIATIERGQLVLSGPLILVGSGLLAGIVRLPVFIHNVSADETFGNDAIVPHELTLDQVYDYETRTKFWGFVTGIVSFESLTTGDDSRLNALQEKGYDFVLTRPGSDKPFVIAESQPDIELPDGMSVNFTVENNEWTIVVYPYSGWEADWKWPVVAAVVVISFLISLMVFIMMVSLKQQGWLLSEMLIINNELAETTTKLEEEKARMDVMLVRQYNLIQCFSGGNPQASVGSDATTMSRIEQMRSQLNHDNVQNLAETEQIEMLDVLGEGSFGKVYKGLWRGTEVAVKTMLLPANMTGTEKREKMAVMEAAISSSLMHPNIVATYTYSIKPVRDTTVGAGAPGGSVAPGIILLEASSMGGSTTVMPKPPESGTTMMTVDNKSQVHSYEVRLVLEFCDRGCLRDALDAGAFFGTSGLKYKAILDTVLDVAKAMMHLHAMNVLHSDLKARNVMLKCSGDARGFIAKVADFGLSVRMDHMETHMSNLFQGTMTHMAPEIMLEGRVSKAADVYAFGITMWELFTGGRPFDGTPRALMGHLITSEHKRPAFNAATPTPYRELAELCWHPDHNKRPSFADILARLQVIRAAEAGAAEPVHYVPKPPAERASGRQHSDNDKADLQAGVSGVAAAKPWEMGSVQTATLSVAAFAGQKPLAAVAEGPAEGVADVDDVRVEGGEHAS